MPEKNRENYEKEEKLGLIWPCGKHTVKLP